MSYKYTRWSWPKFEWLAIVRIAFLWLLFICFNIFIFSIFPKNWFMVSEVTADTRRNICLTTLLLLFILFLHLLRCIALHLWKTDACCDKERKHFELEISKEHRNVVPLLGWLWTIRLRMSKKWYFSTCRYTQTINMNLVLGFVSFLFILLLPVACISVDLIEKRLTFDNFRTSCAMHFWF